jgi:DNA-binding GntR family transcriptional regulator
VQKYGFRIAHARYGIKNNTKSVWRDKMERGIYQTKSEIIYQEIKEDIINGKYKPNERIVISDVAREFGASDIPVREAMRHLESDGLIQSKPYVGAIVTNFDLADIRKIYQIRAVLEGLATRQAVDRIDKNGFKKLETILSKMMKAAGSTMLSMPPLIMNT